MSNHSDSNLTQRCRKRLLDCRRDLIKQYQITQEEFKKRDFSGDIADLSAQITAEKEWSAHQNRIRQQLVEVDSALLRIKNGTFGICEKTEEAIEERRLLAIPWTRFSIEGAEIKDSD